MWSADQFFHLCACTSSSWSAGHLPSAVSCLPLGLSASLLANVKRPLCFCYAAASLCAVLPFFSSSTRAVRTHQCWPRLARHPWLSSRPLCSSRPRQALLASRLQGCSLARLPPSTTMDLCSQRFSSLARHSGLSIHHSCQHQASGCALLFWPLDVSPSLAFLLLLAPFSGTPTSPFPTPVTLSVTLEASSPFPFLYCCSYLRTTASDTGRPSAGQFAGPGLEARVDRLNSSFDIISKEGASSTLGATRSSKCCRQQLHHNPSPAAPDPAVSNTVGTRGGPHRCGQTASRMLEIKVPKGRLPMSFNDQSNTDMRDNCTITVIVHQSLPAMHNHG